MNLVMSRLTILVSKDSMETPIYILAIDIVAALTKTRTHFACELANVQTNNPCV